MNEDTRGAVDAPEGESFAELFDRSYVDPGRLEPGRKVEATIIKITGDWIFIDLGRKGEGCLDRKEFLDGEGRLAVKEGDAVRAFFVSAAGSELRFTTKIGGGAAGQAQIEDAWKSGIPVDGYVEREIKGGYEVRIGGGVRAFCPHSRMGWPRENEPAEYVGKHLSFKVTQYGERGRNIVLSRRAILEEEREARKDVLKSRIREGVTVKGTITRVRDFGAFVRIGDGDIEGLIPISEIGWGRVENIHEALAVGAEVEAVVTQADWEKERFSLSLKKTLKDPWESAAGRYPAGSVHAGRVVRLAPFGAFVALEPGVDGLVHVSRLGGGKRLKHPGEALREGQVLDVKVESIDAGKRRISLVPAAASREETAGEPDEDYRLYVQEKPRSLGTLGEALSAKLAEKAKRTQGS